MVPVRPEVDTAPTIGNCQFRAGLFKTSVGAMAYGPATMITVS